MDVVTRPMRAPAPEAEPANPYAALRWSDDDAPMEAVRDAQSHQSSERAGVRDLAMGALARVREGGERAGASSAPAPSVLLLHGQPGCGALWHPVVEAVEERFRLLYPRGFDIRAPDRPGWGANALPARGIAANAEAEFEELDRRGVERTIVIGHSWGAAVAVAMAARQPSRVSGLILLAPAAAPETLNAMDHLLGAPLAGSLGSFFGFTAAETLLRAPSLGSAVLGRAGAGAVASCLRLARPFLNPRRDWRSFAVEQQALVRELNWLETRLRLISVPTLVMVGARDRAVRPAAVRRLTEKIPRAELLELPALGHHLPVEAVDAIAAAIVLAAGGRAAG